jgi:hypothetical protein
MSMTTVAFLRKADIPTKSKLEDIICKLGYNFKIFNDLENLYEQDAFTCILDGNEICFEIYFEEPTEVTNNCDWIKPDLTNQDMVISFISRGDYAVGACINIILVALIDNSNALIYYLDDQMKYSREMLMDEIPQFLKELEKSKIITQPNPPTVEQPKIIESKKNIWERFKDIFK